MTPGMELPFLTLFNVTCTECLDLGPPPDSILAIPPPPLPSFLLRAPVNQTTACGAACDWSVGTAEFVELTIQEDGDSSDTVESPSGRQIGAPLQETWLIVLITSFVGVLAMGSLLAIFLLKLKHFFRERGTKVALKVDSGAKGCEILYPAGMPDSRVLWATLTPRGTTLHVTSPASTRSFDNSGYVEAEDFLRIRPRVSSPTRIEHPNLPPLNLHRPLRRETSASAPIV